MQNETSESNIQKSVGLLYLSSDDIKKNETDIPANDSSSSSNIYDTTKKNHSHTGKNIFQGMIFEIIFRSERFDFELSQQTERYLRVTTFEEDKHCFIGKLYEQVDLAKSRLICESKNWKQVKGKSTNKLFRQYKIYVQYDEFRIPTYYKIIKSAAIGIIDQHPEELIYKRIF